MENAQRLYDGRLMPLWMYNAFLAGDKIINPDNFREWLYTEMMRMGYGPYQYHPLEEDRLMELMKILGWAR